MNALDSALSAFSDEVAKVGSSHKDGMAAALAAADAVMFSEAAIERAAKLLCAANNLNFDFWERYPEDSLVKAKYRDQARAVVAALREEA